MCILVTRAPASKMTKSSLEQLDVVTTLFENAAPTCKSAAASLVCIPILERSSS